MAVTVDRAFVESYKSNVLHLAQQREARLRDYVFYEPMIGETHNFERLGTVDTVQRSTRHSDTPVLDAPFSRRRVSPQDWKFGDLVDREDKLRMLIAPESNIAMAAAKSHNRKTDEIIIAGALGDARDHTDTAVPLPAAQILNAGAANASDANPGAAGQLTFADLQRVKKRFDDEEVDEEDRVAVIASHQLNINMLSMDQVVNQDYNPVNVAYRDGKLKFKWMGFTWIRTQLLPIATSVRQCLFYDKNSVGLAVNEEMYNFIEPRWDKEGAHQLFSRQTMGATRIEEVGVIRLDCAEA